MIDDALGDSSAPGLFINANGRFSLTDGAQLNFGTKFYS